MQTVPVTEEYYEDAEVCSVCGKWQPDGLNLELQLQLLLPGASVSNVVAGSI